MCSVQIHFGSATFGSAIRIPVCSGQLKLLFGNFSYVFGSAIAEPNGSVRELPNRVVRFGKSSAIVKMARSVRFGKSSAIEKMDRSVRFGSAKVRQSVFWFGSVRQ